MRRERPTVSRKELKERIIEALRVEGPMKASELEEHLKASHSSLHRALKELIEENRVRKVRTKEGPKYELVAVVEDRVERLRHSRKLFEEATTTCGESVIYGCGIPQVIFDTPTYDLEGTRCLRLDYRPIVDHLRTSRDPYQKHIYSLYEEWNKAKKEVWKWWNVFQQEVKDIVTRRGFIIADVMEAYSLDGVGRTISPSIYEAVFDHLHSRLNIPVKVEYDDKSGYLMFEGIGLSKNKGLKKEIEDLLKEILESKEVKETYINLIKAIENRDRAWREYGEALVKLKRKVKHGTPLDGLCDLCPKEEKAIR